MSENIQHGRNEYRNVYLKSPKWRGFVKMMRNNGYLSQCFICGSDSSIWEEQLDPHHTTYKNIGNEEISDIVCLCEFCHAKLHERIKREGLKLEDAHIIIYNERQERIQNPEGPVHISVVLKRMNEKLLKN